MEHENMNKVQKLTFSAMVIALYVVILSFTQSFSFGAYQIRIATSLYALSYLFPFLVIPLWSRKFHSKRTVRRSGYFGYGGRLPGGYCNSSHDCKYPKAVQESMPDCGSHCGISGIMCADLAVLLPFRAIWPVGSQSVYWPDHTGCCRGGVGEGFRARPGYGEKEGICVEGGSK